MNRIFLILFLLSFSIVSCRNVEKEALTDMLSSWEGRTLMFPENPVFTRYATDTVAFSASSSTYTILHYVDSTGCQGCKLQLLLWDDFIHEADSVAGGNLSFLFYMHPKDIRDLRHSLKFDDFQHPICIDTKDSLNLLNRFPTDERLHTFLLNSRNEVVAMGNPARNQSVRNLYMQIISGELERTP